MVTQWTTVSRGSGFLTDSAEEIQFLLGFAEGPLGSGDHALETGEFLVAVAEGSPQGEFSSVP